MIMKKTILLFFILLGLTGCAINSRYVNYTDQKFAPKPGHYAVAIYPASQKIVFEAPYYVIGKLDLSSYASAGETPETLRDYAQKIARNKGADAIINAVAENILYNEVYVRPAYFGRYGYHPREYIPYGDALLTFRGELIVFKSNTTADAAK
jgi:Prokaryotic membrane lipoprotein lipid attachment site